MAIEEPEKTQLYKCVSEMIDVFQSEPGIKLFRRMCEKYHFPHYMICNLHHFIFSHHEGACQPKFLSILKSDANIPYQDSPGMARNGFDFSKANVWAAISGVDTMYANPPATWALFSPRSLNKHYRLDDIDTSPTENTAMTKRQRTVSSTTNTRTNNTQSTNNIQRVKEELSDTQKENAKKQGFLIAQGTRVPLFSHTFKSFSNRQLCPGFCYLDKYCYFPTTFSKAHISSLEKIKDDTDRH